MVIRLPRAESVVLAPCSHPETSELTRARSRWRRRTAGRAPMLGLLADDRTCARLPTSSDPPISCSRRRSAAIWRVALMLRASLLLKSPCLQDSGHSIRHWNAIDVERQLHGISNVATGAAGPSAAASRDGAPRGPRPVRAPGYSKRRASAPRSVSSRSSTSPGRVSLRSPTRSSTSILVSFFFASNLASAFCFC